MTPLYILTPLYIVQVLNSGISNNKKQVKQVAVSKKVKCWSTNTKTRQIFVYHNILTTNDNKLFFGEKIRVESKQNCYNAEKVLSIVAPSGEQELM